jgi:hypothetical protein
MEPITEAPEELAIIKPVVLHEQDNRPILAARHRRYCQSRVGAWLTSFPSRVFLLALTFYLLLTNLHLWLHSASNDQQVLSSSLNLAAWGSAFTAAWRHFDSYFFLHIAQLGYTNQGLGAFFPLYPALIRLFAWLLSGHFTLAALVVSWLAAWGSYLWFYRLAEREYGSQVARFSLLFLACCPVSLFSFAPYSESLFLLVSIGAVERARAGRLWQAGMLAALGMLTRPTGILLLIPLGWEWARRSPLFAAPPAWLRPVLPRWLFQAEPPAQSPARTVETTPEGRAPAKPACGSGRLRELGSRTLAPVGRSRARACAGSPHPNLPRLAWLSLGLVPLALASYMLYLKVHTGNALAFLAGESDWHRRLALPWETAAFFVAAFQYAAQARDYTAFVGNIVDLLLVLPLSALVLYCALRRRSLWLGAALYQQALAVMLIAVPNVPEPSYGEEVLLSTQRFMLPAFPIFLLLGQLGIAHPWLYRLLLSASLLMLTLNTLHFLDGIFIA